MTEVRFSLRGRKTFGRYYNNSKNISIFPNVIYRLTPGARVYFGKFMKWIIGVTIHEYFHWACDKFLGNSWGDSYSERRQDWGHASLHYIMNWIFPWQKEFEFW